MSPEPAFSPRRRRGLVPDEPPAEVLAEIAAADERWQHLRDDGRQVHFGIGAFTRRMSAELRDDDGELLESLTPRRVLELSCGALPF